MTSLNNNEKYVLIENKVEICISKMLNYQRINNIENNCITNTLFIYELIREILMRYRLNTDVVRIIPIIVVLENNIINAGHLVVQYREQIYECSYDIFKNRNNIGFKYFKSIHELFINFKTRDNDKKKMIELYIHFNTQATLMNGGKRLIETISGEQYLNDMRDYVDRC